MHYLEWTGWVLSALLALSVGVVGFWLVQIFLGSVSRSDRRTGAIAAPIILVLACHPWLHLAFGALPPTLWWTLPSCFVSGLLAWFGIHGVEAAARP